VARLTYSAITSLDGYSVDADGGFDWAEPDEEVHRFVNERERPVGTYLYGRAMYQTMVFWATDAASNDGPEYSREYAQIWQAADKVVYSTTLTEASSPRTRIEPAFDPAAVQRLKESAQQPLSVGGPGLAVSALRAGLVDELEQFACPVVVGGGTRWLPDGVRFGLDLVDERTFGNGTVWLHYRVRR
jgi:dihydrofolate reductase